MNKKEAAIKVELETDLLRKIEARASRAGKPVAVLIVEMLSRQMNRRAQRATV
jgi:predicted DNA binding CopG/RHH family protein